MNKYGIMFAGQGAQRPGMGRGLYEMSHAARAVFDLAGEKIKHDCFETDEEYLKQTEVTQPAVYTMDMAAYAALREKLGAGNEGYPEPSGVAGFSLGEYAAYTAAGVIRSLEDGIALVRKRSQLMKAAGTGPDGAQIGAMAAGMGSIEAVLDLVEKTRGDDVLEAVNFNSPLQIVVAGDEAAVQRFTASANEDRGLGVKAVPLAVSGAFHSPLMRSASEGFAEALAEYSFNEPSLPLYLNVTGAHYREYSEMAVGSASAKVRALMAFHIQSPVQWQSSVEAMAADGIETMIEIGPGRTLSGLVRRIAPGITTYNVEDAESLSETVKRIMEG